MKTETQERNFMRGSALEVLIPRRRGVPFEDALKIAEQGRCVLASNARLSKALFVGEEWKGLTKAFPCWTGTMTAYAKPGEKLGDTIEYIDPNTNRRWVFPVPQQFRGEKDCILVSEHPDYTIENDGENRIVRAMEVYIVGAFPASSGFFPGDAMHDIPFSREIDLTTKGPARYLARADSGVFPAMRGVDSGNEEWDGRGGLMVCLSLNPSDCLGAIIEDMTAIEFAEDITRSINRIARHLPEGFKV